MGYVLGVDLGTTYTAAATLDGGVGVPEMVGLGNRALQIPSVLFRQPDGSFLVGESAVRRGATEPGFVVREFKRRIGDHVPILVAGVPYSPQALTAQLLRWVFDETCDRAGTAPDYVVLTHPANWSAFKIDLLRQAADLADVGPVATCTEPVAAARQHVQSHHIDIGSRVCIFDLGGGTFDVAVLVRTAAGFDVVGAPTGLEHLGGIDFDEALFHRVLDNAGLSLGDVHPDDPSLEASLTRLRQDCVEAKEALSTDVEVVVSTSISGRDIDVRLTRGEFEDLIKPAVRDAIGATDRALRSAHTTSDDLAAFVVVGGSSRIPLVTESLISTYRRPIARTTHPKHDIALGATRSAGPEATEPAVGVSPNTRQSRRSAGPQARAGKDALAVQNVLSMNPGASGDDGGAAATEPGSEQGARPRPAIELSPVERSRRRLSTWLAIGVFVAVIAVVGVTALVQRGQGAASPGAASGTSSSSPVPSTSPAPASPVDAAGLSTLPRSIPLPDAAIVAVRETDGVHDLFVIDSETGQIGQQLTTGGADGPVFSPDRRSIVYTTQVSTTEGAMRVVAADGTGDRDLFSPALEGCSRYLTPAWNPVQQDELALPCLTTDYRFSMRLVRLDGTVIREFDTGGGWANDPSFSPDGRTIAYNFNTNPDLPGGSIRTVLADGSAPAITVTGPVTDSQPMWSPDGSKILFRRELGPDHRYGVYIMSADGSDQTAVGPSAADDREPAWSPDGSKIVFRSNRDQVDPTSYRYFLMSSTGADVQLLSPDDSAKAFLSVIAWARR